MDKAGQTIAQLFEDRINSHKEGKFDIEKAIAHRVSTINDGIARLDLLPSSIRTLKGKYGDAYNSLHNITQEIKQLCEKKKY
jgi:hypothetical protein